MPGIVAGKVALVTGGGAGIGRGIAELLAREGAAVVVANRTTAAGQETVERIRAAGGQAVFQPTDITREADCQAAVACAVDTYGRIDCLVNNAGIFPRATVLELDEATWDQVHDVNLKGTFFCSQEAARMMIPRRSGRIINIASISGLEPTPRGSHYSASKAGVIALTKSIAWELGPYHIAVNAVAPGITDTAQPRYGMTEEEIAAAGDATPWGRIGKPDDVARAVLYLASDLSEYVTGETVFVTGGSFMSP